ncbi:MAG: metal ABC transporter permease, partial [Alphaproteobacteria bacterium]|nr:metal ABC transporter permease [Alphaproteobacteria bacterium]
MLDALYAFWIEPIAEFMFLKKALVGVFVLSIGSAPIGVLLILRRMSLMGDALSHAILPGIAIGFWIAGFSL